MQNQNAKKRDSSSLKSPSPLSSSSTYNYPHKFRTAYGPKLQLQHITPPGEGRAKQSFKEECDINHIMARYQRTGVLDFAARREPQYGDCTGLEFQAGMELVAKAKAMFEELPSSLRARFENEPARFLDFVNNPRNREEAQELGLLKPKAEEATPLPPPPAKAAEEPLPSRSEVRKAAREAGERKERSDD